MTLIYLYKWNYIGYGKSVNLKIFVHDFWKKQLIESCLSKINLHRLNIYFVLFPFIKMVYILY